MSFSEALSKLHEILRVLIGDCAEDWRTQKQQTGFTTDWEWAEHLLSVHRSHCNKDNCHELAEEMQQSTGSPSVGNVAKSPSAVLPSQTMFKATRPFKSKGRHMKQNSPRRSLSHTGDGDCGGGGDVADTGGGGDAMETDRSMPPIIKREGDMPDISDTDDSEDLAMYDGRYHASPASHPSPAAHGLSGSGPYTSSHSTIASHPSVTHPSYKHSERQQGWQTPNTHRIIDQTANTHRIIDQTANTHRTIEQTANTHRVIEQTPNTHRVIDQTPHPTDYSPNSNTQTTKEFAASKVQLPTTSSQEFHHVDNPNSNTNPNLKEFHLTADKEYAHQSHSNKLDFQVHKLPDMPATRDMETQSQQSQQRLTPKLIETHRSGAGDKPSDQTQADTLPHRGPDDVHLSREDAHLSHRAMDVSSHKPPHEAHTHKVVEGHVTRQGVDSQTRPTNLTPHRQLDFSAMVGEDNEESWQFAAVEDVSSSHNNHPQGEVYYEEDIKPNVSLPQSAASVENLTAVVGSHTPMGDTDPPPKHIPPDHTIPLRHQGYDERLLLSAAEQARAELLSAGNLPHLEATMRHPIDLTDHQRLPVFPNAHQPISPDNIHIPPTGPQYRQEYNVQDLDRMVGCRPYNMTKEPGERPLTVPTSDNIRIPNMSPFSSPVSPVRTMPDIRQMSDVRPTANPHGRLSASAVPDLQRLQSYGMMPFNQPMRRTSMPFSEFERAAIVQQAVASIVPTEMQRSPLPQQYYQSRRMSTGTDAERLPNFSSLQLPRRNTIDSTESERSGSDSSDPANNRHNNHLLDDIKTEGPQAKRPRGRPKRSSEGDSPNPTDPVYHRFTCTVCSKGFPFKHSLTAHLRVHTGERPFSCDVCASTFTQLGSLNTHKKLHNQPVFKCTICNWSTRKQELLEKHIKLHYNDGSMGPIGTPTSECS